MSLAVHDIAARYRGSVLGPWWITITMGALVLGIGLNYGALYHKSIGELLPYVGLGIVTWGFISTCISEGGEAFVSAGAMLRQSALPLPLFIMRCLFRNVFYFAHHSVVIVLTLLYMQHFPGLGIAWSLLGLALTLLNLAWIVLLVAFLSAVFRDVPQIIVSFLQLAFFLTPVFWEVPPSMVNRPLVKYNPLYYAVESIRRPLLGSEPPLSSYALLAGVAVVGWVVAILVYNQTRRRVVHYL